MTKEKFEQLLESAMSLIKQGRKSIHMDGCQVLFSDQVDMSIWLRITGPDGCAAYHGELHLLAGSLERLLDNQVARLIAAGIVYLEKTHPDNQKEKKTSEPMELRLLQAEIDGFNKGVQTAVEILRAANTQRVADLDRILKGKDHE